MMIMAYNNTEETLLIGAIVEATQLFYARCESESELGTGEQKKMITFDSIVGSKEVEAINKPKSRPFYKSIKRKLKHWE